MAFPVRRILDNFNRANEGPPPSSSWVTNAGNGNAVVSNQCKVNTYGGGTGDGSTWNTSFAADQEVYITIATVGTVSTYMVVIVRLTTNTTWATNHYELDMNAVLAANDTVNFWKYSSGTYTQLGSDVDLGGNLAANDVFGLRVIGTELEGFRNGVSLGTRTDGDVTAAGFIGFVMEDPATAWIVDDFGGGNFVGMPIQNRSKHNTLLRM